jgi:hypothetical protein
MHEGVWGLSGERGGPADVIDLLVDLPQLAAGAESAPLVGTAESPLPIGTAQPVCIEDTGVGEEAEEWSELTSPSVLGTLADLDAAVERYAARRRPGLDPEAQRDEMVGLRRLIDRLELEFAGLVAELSTLDELEWEGHRSPIEWVRHECHTWGAVAGDALHVGLETARLQESTRAMLAGEIGFAHLAQLARTSMALTTSATSSGFDESALLDLARRHSVARFRSDCDHARHAADQRRFLEDQVAAVEARSLELKRYQNGCFALHGFLDPEGGAAVRTALEPLAHPAGPDDDRSHARRWADALIELAGNELDAGVLPQLAGQRPHLQVTCTLETVQGLRGSPAAELELGGPIAAVTVQRLACDASVSRVVFDADSAVVDVGRVRRLPAAATRRALHARDHGCVWPGCERPPSWTQTHHLIHWAHGGSTDLDNLVLICRYHHWKVHEGGWQLVRGEHGLAVLPPLPRELGLAPVRAPTR